MVVSLGAVTDIGRVRKSNQDTYCALAGDNVPVGIDALVAVADGMGGGPAGDVASALAIEGLIKGVSIALEEFSSTKAGELGEALSRVLVEVNADVYRASQEAGRRGMGTTLTVGVVAGATFVVGNVGDSRAYGVSAGHIHQISVDHSWVEEQVSMGAMTQEQAERHAYRNMLTRCVGPSLDVQVDTFSGRLDSGDALFLCSDGLYRLVNDSEIEQILASAGPQVACEELVNVANARGGIDNVTAVALRMT